MDWVGDAGEQPASTTAGATADASNSKEQQADGSAGSDSSEQQQQQPVAASSQSKAKQNECGHPERKHYAHGRCAQCDWQLKKQRKASASAAAADNDGSNDDAADAADTAAAEADSGDAPKRDSNGRRVNQCGHPERKHRALGRCNSCYRQMRKEQESAAVAAAAEAGEHSSAAEDATAYSNDGSGDAPMRDSSGRRVNTCGHPERKYRSLGRCNSCYQQMRKEKETTAATAAAAAAAEESDNA
eukprot:12887-Heterococcus_DN1.PRE.1